jgi:hypothetical protein
MTNKDDKEIDVMSGKSNILLYQTEDNRQRLEVILDNGTVWLSQKQLSELYMTSTQNITIHIRNIYSDRELDLSATCKDYLQVQLEGNREVSRSLTFYNLEVIIAIGYRVRSHRGVQFRQWATERLQEYIIKGFVLDDERLSNPGIVDYYDELLERIRQIRMSEKRFYQKIRDIYTLSADYDPQHPMTQEFFAIVQNKLLYAVTHNTAAELIYQRADADKTNMGLTTWKGIKRGRKPSRQDIETAKNYLNLDEIQTLELLVNQYLDFAELQARQRKTMYMQDWKNKLDDFLKVNDQEILSHAGKISTEMAKEIANQNYDTYIRNIIKMEADKADDELKQTLKRLKKIKNLNKERH